MALVMYVGTSKAPSADAPFRSVSGVETREVPGAGSSRLLVGGVSGVNVIWRVSYYGNVVLLNFLKFV